MSDDLFVCAIGASAGGLSPIEEFFDNVEEKSGIAYVVIQHLSPDHESMMSAVLGRHTSMPVTQAVDGTTLEPVTGFTDVFRQVRSGMVDGCEITSADLEDDDEKCQHGSDRCEQAESNQLCPQRPPAHASSRR